MKTQTINENRKRREAANTNHRQLQCKDRSGNKR